MENTLDSITLDDDLGGQLERRRFLTLMHETFEQLVPLARQVEHTDAANALALLDFYLPSVGSLFDVVIRLPQPPFQSLCDLLKQLNKYLNTRGLYREQVEWAQSLLSYFLEHEGETGDKIDLVILNTIASGFDALGEHEDALDIYDFIIDLYADDPDHPGLAVICFNAAVTHHRIGNIEQALALCQRSIAIDEQHDNPRGIATSLLLLSDLLHAQGNAEGIFQALKRATELIEPLDNRYLHAQVTAKTALHTARYHDWERAAELFKAAIAMWRDIGDEEQLAGTLFNYAVLLQETGSHAEALTCAQESLTLLEQHNLFHAETVREALEEWRSNGAE